MLIALAQMSHNIYLMFSANGSRKYAVHLNVTCASDSILQKDNNDVVKVIHSHVHIVLTEPKSNTKGKIHTHAQILIITNRELKNKTKKKRYL